MNKTAISLAATCSLLISSFAFSGALLGGKVVPNKQPIIYADTWETIGNEIVGDKCQGEAYGKYDSVPMNTNYLVEGRAILAHWQTVDKGFYNRLLSGKYNAICYQRELIINDEHYLSPVIHIKVDTTNKTINLAPGYTLQYWLVHIPATNIHK